MRNYYSSPDIVKKAEMGWASCTHGEH